MFPRQDLHTVKEIWQLALPIGTHLVGGGSGLSKPVTWVTPTRATYPLFGRLESGYMVLAHLEFVRQLDPPFSVAQLIRELGRAEAAALVVDEPVSSEAASLADELAMPLFVLPPGVSLGAVEREVLRTLVDIEGQLAWREREIRQLLQQAYSHAGLEGVLRELAHFVQGQACVEDEQGLSLGCAGAAASPLREWVYPIQVVGRSLGKLLLRLPKGRRHLLDPLYAEQAAEICGLELLQRRTRQEAEERLGMELVEQLLDERQDPELLQSRLLRLGYELKEDIHHLVAVCLEGQNQFVQRLRWAAQQGGGQMLSLPYGGQLVHLLGGASDEKEMRRWIEDAAQGLDLLVGVSRLVQGIEGLRLGIQQALEAWDLGAHMGRPSICYYGEMGLFRLLVSLRDRAELKRFAQEVLGVIQEYDAAHGTDLLQTLEAFFSENANASRTAQVLYIHRNTLNYRLQRIAEISGLNLDDPENRLALQLALKIYRLLGK